MASSHRSALRDYHTLKHIAERHQVSYCRAFRAAQRIGAKPTQCVGVVALFSSDTAAAIAEEIQRVKDRRNGFRGVAHV